MLTLYALLCVMYILLVIQSNDLKQLYICEKNNKQLTDEIKVLKNTLEFIINVQANKTINLSTCPNFHNCSGNLTSFQI